MVTKELIINDLRIMQDKLFEDVHMDSFLQRQLILFLALNIKRLQAADFNPNYQDLVSSLKRAKTVLNLSLKG